MSSFYPLPHLPSTRRLVTGHSPNGKAIFTHDDHLTAVNPRPDISPENEHSVPGFYLIHRTTDYPVEPQGPESELSNHNLARSKHARGDIICEIVDVPPMSGTADGSKKNGEAVLMHRNESLDYGVILKGSITLILDDGVEKTLSEGDVFVQRGTMHGWQNTSSEHCRFMTVIIPSAPVKVTSGGVLNATKIPGLTD